MAIVKGLCIAKRNRGWRTSFTIRNHIGNAGGIERTFPLCVAESSRHLKLMQWTCRKLLSIKSLLT